MENRYPSGGSEVSWVSAEWLENHLSDRDLTILDVQPGMDGYLREHIPGALHMSSAAVSAPLAGIPGAFIPMESMQPILRGIGLIPGAPVVVYSGRGTVPGCGDGLEQAVVAYALVRFGHDAVHILNGGIDRWRAEKKPLAQEFPEVETSRFSCHLRSEFFIEYEDFRSIKDNGDVILLDARDPEPYTGQSPWIRPGHIPGALNFPWRDCVDPENPLLLREADDIRHLAGARGIDPGKMALCSGGTARDTAFLFLLFKYFLGYPSVRAYEGAFTEWTAYPGNPSVSGDMPYTPESERETVSAGT